MLAGPLARELGAAWVIGSAGGPCKARSLVPSSASRRGLDCRAPIAEQFAKAAPEGIDTYLDNVAANVARPPSTPCERGRIAMVGAVSAFNPAQSPRGSARSASRVSNQAPAALIGVLRGVNTGKMLVRFADEAGSSRKKA